MSKANEPETVVLTDASGAERECICIDRLTVDGRVYTVFSQQKYSSRRGRTTFWRYSLRVFGKI